MTLSDGSVIFSVESAVSSVLCDVTSTVGFLTSDDGSDDGSVVLRDELVEWKPGS